MVEITEQFKLLCVFCGEVNILENSELYELQDQEDSLREKFCVNCGEPLTTRCRICQKGFILSTNFEKHAPVNVLPSFWEPTPSQIDHLIPQLKEEFQSYQNIAQKLTPDTFRQSQKDFLNEIPKIREILAQLSKSIQILDSFKPKTIEREYSRLAQKLQELSTECQEIQLSIDPALSVVSEKKEKILRKSVPFIDLFSPMELLIKMLTEFRQAEIKSEKLTWEPGYERIKHHFKQNPKFFQLTCPICNNDLFFINHQIYSISQSDLQVKLLENLPQFYQSRPEQNYASNLVRFKVYIHIERDKIYDLTGQLSFTLNEGQSEVIGRDVLKSIAYTPIQDHGILEEENNLLSWVSRSQVTISRKNMKIVAQALPFDERRVGTYLNSREIDIRKHQPDGNEISPGSKIIIPLNIEEKTPNFIELSYIS